MSLKEREARRLCEKALQTYFDDSQKYARQRKDFVSSSDAHKKLSVDEICDGVCLFTIFAKMGGGSIGTINLYSLLQRYLLDVDMRRKINELLGFHFDVHCYPKQRKKETRADAEGLRQDDTALAVLDEPSEVEVPKPQVTNVQTTTNFNVEHLKAIGFTDSDGEAVAVLEHALQTVHYPQEPYQPIGKPYILDFAKVTRQYFEYLNKQLSGKADERCPTVRSIRRGILELMDILQGKGELPKPQPSGNISARCEHSVRLPRAVDETPEPQVNKMYQNVKTWNPAVGCGFNCIYCKPSFQAVVAWSTKQSGVNCDSCITFHPHEHAERLSRIPSKDIIFAFGNGDISFYSQEFVGKAIDALIENLRRSKKSKTVYFQSKDPKCFAKYFDQLGPIADSVVLLPTMVYCGGYILERSVKNVQETKCRNAHALIMIFSFPSLERGSRQVQDSL